MGIYVAQDRDTPEYKACGRKPTFDHDSALAMGFDAYKERHDKSMEEYNDCVSGIGTDNTVIKKIPASTYLVSVVALLGAIYLANKHKRGAWGYVGYIVLGGLVSASVNTAITSIKNK